MIPMSNIFHSAFRFVNRQTGIFWRNPIDAFLIRKEKQKDVTDLKIKFSSETINAPFDNTQKELTIKCSDNGIGLGVDQTKAFVTQFTSYKDDLKIKGIGECKGSGRIQYLLYFYNN